MNLDLLTQHVGDGITPLLRTDFSDNAAWERVVDAVTAEADFGSDDPEEELVEDGPYAPNIAAVEDRTFEGATGDALADAADGATFGYVILGDERAMREAVAGDELTVVYVDLSVESGDAAEFGWEQGREFRCEAGEIAGIESNLSIANLDFADFADHVADDGVFRGFPEER